MKKIYLITFHGSVNYGAVLQAYALSKAIEQLGGVCEVIDYNREQHHRNYLQIKGKNIKSIVYQMTKMPQKIRMHRKFDRFTRKRMRLTERSYNGIGALYNQEFSMEDAYLVGSDQVWNCQLTENNLHYYLDFVQSKRKYSYASSFGVSSINGWENTDIVQQLLSEFRMISVREESGKRIIEENLNKEARVVCDPTFLLKKEEWLEIAVKPKRRRYVLLFMLAQDERLVELAREKARELQVDVVNLIYTGSKIAGCINVWGLSPEEWLGYIWEAEAVYTNSFHGFALSLNFRKQVFVALSQGGRNSRITDLANRHDIKNAMIGDGRSWQPIDYERVAMSLEEERQSSLNYLKEIIEDATKPD